jgi:hypothetical protein
MAERIGWEEWSRLRVYSHDVQLLQIIPGISSSRPTRAVRSIYFQRTAYLETTSSPVSSRLVSFQPLVCRLAGLNLDQKTKV